MRQKPVLQNTVHVIVPVFNRLQITRDCISQLQAQTYPNIEIIIADGGSTDGSFETLKQEFLDVTFLEPEKGKELWWAGATALGIDYLLANKVSASDMVMLLNNDTIFDENFVSGMVDEYDKLGGVVAPIEVDAANPDRIINCGTRIEWRASGDFKVHSLEDPGETYAHPDVMTGRGAMMKFWVAAEHRMDVENFPHYMADYDFFYAMKQKGVRLSMTPRVRIGVILAKKEAIDSISLLAFIKQSAVRNSPENIFDRWRFVKKHSPSHNILKTGFIFMGKFFHYIVMRFCLKKV